MKLLKLKILGEDVVHCRKYSLAKFVNFVHICITCENKLLAFYQKRGYISHTFQHFGKKNSILLILLFFREFPFFGLNKEFVYYANSQFEAD